jgi:hypothetical protein
MKKSIHRSLIVFLMTMVFAADGSFFLPDLFVTAKGQSNIDTVGRKSILATPNIKAQLSKELVDTYLLRKDVILDQIPQTDQSSSTLFNNVRLEVGLPSHFDFTMNHGYFFDGHPYFLTLSRLFDLTEYGTNKESGLFSGAIRWSPGLLINVKVYSKKLEDTDFNYYTLFTQMDGELPISYLGSMYQSNAYSGNQALSYFQNKLSVDLGDIEILSNGFPAKVKAETLSAGGSNQYVSLALDLEKEVIFFNQQYDAIFGVNSWINSGSGQTGFHFKGRGNYSLGDDSSIDLTVGLLSKMVNLDHVFEFDYSEHQDNKLVPDDERSIKLKIHNSLKQNEILHLNYTNYGSITVFDDVDLDDYYELSQKKNASILEVGGQLDNLIILSENINVLVRLPLISELPNQFIPLISLTHEASLWGGFLESKVLYMNRELGRGTQYKDGYFDVELRYGKKISDQINLGASSGNLFSSNANKLLAHPIGSMYIKCWVDVIF